MGYEFVRKPLMLLETMEMLIRYASQIDFRSTLPRKSIPTEALIRRTDRLQEIVQEVCGDLDPRDPVLQRYFLERDVDCEQVCVAYLLLGSSFDLTKPDLREYAQHLCQDWERNMKNGGWILPESVSSLLIAARPGCPGDLYDQISALALPGDLQMTLYGALRSYDKTVWQLVEFMEPYARKLAAVYESEDWLFREQETYWTEVFQHVQPLEYLSRLVGDFAVDGAAEHTLVYLSLMNQKRVAFSMGIRDNVLPFNQIILGSAIQENNMARRRGSDLGDVGVILKALGDKKRLEILRRLTGKRAYCHELAEAMGVDPGNMSRNLATLYHYGFLRLEREPFRSYYQTDVEAFRNFLQVLESIVS